MLGLNTPEDQLGTEDHKAGDPRGINVMGLIPCDRRHDDHELPPLITLVVCSPPRGWAGWLLVQTSTCESRV